METCIPKVMKFHKTEHSKVLVFGLPTQYISSTVTTMDSNQRASSMFIQISDQEKEVLTL